MTFRGPYHLYASKGRADRIWFFEDLEKARDMQRECWAHGWDTQLFRVTRMDGRDLEEEIE